MCGKRTYVSSNVVRHLCLTYHPQIGSRTTVCGQQVLTDINVGLTCILLEGLQRSSITMYDILIPAPAFLALAVFSSDVRLCAPPLHIIVREQEYHAPNEPQYDPRIELLSMDRLMRQTLPSEERCRPTRAREDGDPFSGLEALPWVTIKFTATIYISQ